MRLQLGRADDYTRIDVLHRLPLAIVFLIAALSITALLACGGDSFNRPPTVENEPTLPPVTPVARPAGVPVTATEVRSSLELGSIVRQAGGEATTSDIRRLVSAVCENDLIWFRTDRESIYAAAACTGFWDAETLLLFVVQDVAIEIAVDDTRFQVFIETVPGAQAEFTASGVWVD